MSSDILDKASLAVHQEMYPNAIVDVNTLFNIGMTVFNMIKKCQEQNAQAMIKSAKREGLLLRISIGRHVDSNLPRRETVDAVLATCAAAKPDELQQLINEVRGSGS